MSVLLEGLLALAAMAGLCCIGCFLYSYLLRPDSAQGTWTVVWGRGAGEGLEQRVRALVWLQSCGLLRCNVVIADAGLDEEGRALAARLVRRWPALTLCARGELARRMGETEP